MSFDMRLILPLFILGIIGLRSLEPNWKTIKYFFIVIGAVNLLNIVLLAGRSTSAPIGAEEATRCCSVFPALLPDAETLWYLSVRFIKMITSFMVSWFSYFP